MTREEMWEEFENQLKREVHTPITISYDDSIRLAELGIKETVARWKERLEQKPKTDELVGNSEELDCISRKAVIASIKNLYPDMPIVDIMGARRKWLDKYAPYFECENAVEQLPSVNPQEPKQGHWDKGYLLPDGEYWRCTKCKELIKVKYPMKYCNNCGSKNE